MMCVSGAMHEAVGLREMIIKMLWNVVQNRFTGDILILIHS